MTEFIKYSVLDNGIHQFVWMDNSEEAVYEYVDYLRQIDQEAKQESKNVSIIIRILHDFRHTTPPALQAMVTSVIEIRPSLKLSANVNFRFAYLSDDPNLIEIIGQVNVLIRKDRKRNFFKVNEESQALEWLLSDE